MNPSATWVAIVDDDDSFRKALERLLRASGYMTLSYSSAEQYLAYGGDPPGCVVTDLRMPGQSGLDLQTALSHKGNAPPMVFLSGQGDMATAVRAMRGGAEDFLAKDAPKEDLLKAVRRAIERGSRQREQRRQLETLRARFNALTPREHEVLQQVVRGQMNKQIADTLGINERTVKLHRTAITTKLNLRSVAELTRLVLDAGLFESPIFPKGQ